MRGGGGWGGGGGGGGENAIIEEMKVEQIHDLVVSPVHLSRFYRILSRIENVLISSA